ncbi:hypothetical protein BGZ90_000647 [Linnemannia elongata]|nr:hypothetical protein BGZ90_000647 [Linnemannia elongata]
MKFLAVATAVVSTLLLATSNVEAHVTANPSVGVSGAYFQTNFRVPHGCEGNATDLVIVEIPKNVTSVKPRATYPWNTTINMIPLAVPIVTPTGTVNMTVGSVTCPSTGGDSKSAAVASQIFGLGQVALVGAGALMLAML